jgi:hypothetical protein
VTCLTPVRRRQTCQNSLRIAVNVAGAVQTRPKQQTSAGVGPGRCSAALAPTTTKEACTCVHLLIELQRSPAIARTALHLGRQTWWAEEPPRDGRAAPTDTM